MTEDPRPEWVERLQNSYLSGGASLFVLHGNVADMVGGGEGDSYSVQTLADFLTERLFGNYDLVLHYDVGRGLRPHAGDKPLRLTRMKALLQRLLGDQAGDLPREPTLALRLLDRLIALLLVGEENRLRKTAVLFDYAELFCAPGDRDAERLAMFLNWARSPVIRRVNLIFILMTEGLGQLNPALVQSGHTEEIHVPLPSLEQRRRFVAAQFPSAAADADRLAALSAGLTFANLDNMMRLLTLAEPPAAEAARAPSPPKEMGEATDGREARAALPAAATATGPSVVTKVSSPPAPSIQSMPPSPSISSIQSSRRIARIKKNLIESQCPGLIEFIEPALHLDMVAGHTAAKERLGSDARLVREGQLDAVPMGYLICGPVGVGKTFLALCYAGTVGIPCVTIRNFRSKYVGETESNLERILTVLRELGPVAVIVDEADAAVGNRAASGDAGTSARVFGQLAAQMGNTAYRGKLIWFLLTCRPDLLPIDLKRQGRCEEHIPLFYPQCSCELREMFMAMARKARLDLPESALPDFSDLPPLSGADIEGVLTRARREALLRNRVVDGPLLQEVLKNFRSVRSSEHELQWLAAILECSDLRYLPEEVRVEIEKPGGYDVFARRFRELQSLDAD